MKRLFPGFQNVIKQNDGEEIIQIDFPISGVKSIKHVESVQQSGMNVLENISLSWDECTRRHTSFI
jgi:hypothetical protein